MFYETKKQKFKKRKCLDTFEKMKTNKKYITVIITLTNKISAKF